MVRSRHAGHRHVPRPRDGARLRCFGSGSDPDPVADVDALEELEEEIVLLAAHLHAAEHRFLTLVAEFDRRRGWEARRPPLVRPLAGLPVRLRSRRGSGESAGGPGPGEAARDQRRHEPGRAVLLDGPGPDPCGHSRERGATSWTWPGAAPPPSSSAWCAASSSGAGRTRRTGRRNAIESRSFSVFPDEEGMYVVKGRAHTRGRSPADASRRGSGRDALYREKGPKSVSYETSFEDAAQRRADALGLVAERALAAGFGAEADDTSSTDSSARAPLSGTRAERYQVLLHVDAETLTEDGEPRSVRAGGRHTRFS